MDDACTNWAEEFFSRMRRAEMASITALPVHTFCGMLRIALGERTTAVCER